MMHGTYGPGGFGIGWGGGLEMILMWIVPIVVVGLIVWLVVGSTRSRDSRDGGSNNQVGGAAQTAVSVSSRGLGILDERYARGEIDREDYLERRRDLER